MSNETSVNLLPLWKVRERLSRLWFIGAGIPFILLVIQSILGHYGGDAQKAWSWFIPTVVPTLGLMVGVIGAAALKPTDDRVVQQGFSTMMWSLSLGYLSILSITILLEPFSPTRGVELLSLSNYWLAPIQGLVVAGLGYLFTSDVAHPSKIPTDPPQAAGNNPGGH